MNKQSAFQLFGIFVPLTASIMMVSVASFGLLQEASGYPDTQTFWHDPAKLVTIWLIGGILYFVSLVCAIIKQFWYGLWIRQKYNGIALVLAIPFTFSLISMNGYWLINLHVELWQTIVTGLNFALLVIFLWKGSRSPLFEDNQQ